MPVVLGVLSVAAAQEKMPPGGQHAAVERLELAFQSGRLAARIQNCTLQRLAGELDLKTRVSIVIAREIAADRVTAEFHDTALDAALHRLFASYDLFFYFGGPTGSTPASVRRVWVYPNGQAGQLRPVPPADWASTRDLEGILADSDPEVRAQAYEALMSSPDPSRRNLVLQALRGVGEERDEMRERILSSAISKGFPLAADLLGDLAQTDRSEQIRWMALARVFTRCEWEAHRGAGSE